MNNHIEETVMTELMTKENNLSIEELSAQLGASSTSSGPSIPALGMNYDGENGPMGAFFLKMGKDGNCQDNVYATENVKFRALSSHIQWQHWQEKELINKTILVNNMRDEARDQLGGIRCGLPEYEDYWKLSEDARKKYEGIDKYRVVRGLVSYTGKTPDGREVTIENHPCVFSGKRKNYGSFYNDIVSKMPKGINLWDFENILSKETKTNAYKKKFYVTRFSPQFGTPIPLDQLTYDSLSYVSNLISTENKRIEDMHKNAVSEKDDAEEADRIMDAVDTLSEDMRV